MYRGVAGIYRGQKPRLANIKRPLVEPREGRRGALPWQQNLEAKPTVNCNPPEPRRFNTPFGITDAVPTLGVQNETTDTATAVSNCKTEVTQLPRSAPESCKRHLLATLSR